MGSLTSTPKIANRVPQTPSPATTAVEETAHEEIQTREKKAEERRKSLLARDRSVAGTIKTSLQGVLSRVDEDTSTSHKTLLGQ